MNLTYYPFKPFHIETGKINIVDTGNSHMYFDLIQGLLDRADSVKISNDDFELQTLSSQCSWYGDLMLTVDLNRLFLKKIQQRLIDLMTDEQQVDLLESSSQMVTQVTDVSFLTDLPLEVSELPNIEKVMKFIGISFPKELASNPTEVLETLIQTHVELGSSKWIVLTNVTHYVTADELMGLSQLVDELNATLLIIEYSESRRMEKFQNACYYYVDGDLVDWRDMS